MNGRDFYNSYDLVKKQYHKKRIYGSDAGTAPLTNAINSRPMPNATPWVFPRTGHAVNNKETELLNRALLDFLIGVDKERWS